MVFEDVLQKAREMASKADISDVGFMAVQVNITGGGSGVFYVEVKDGRISVEPYDYYDRQCALTIAGDDFARFVAGELDPVEAFTSSRLWVDGDLGRALDFANLVQDKK